MNRTPSAFYSDHLQLTRWECIKLLLGFTLREKWQPIVVSTKPKEKDE